MSQPFCVSWFQKCLVEKEGEVVLQRLKEITADERITYIGKGVLVGIVAGMVVSLFRLGIEVMVEWVGEMYVFLQELPAHLGWWIPLSILVAVIVGLLAKGEPHIKGSGIPQVEGQVRGLLHLDWWSVMWKKFVGGLLSIGSGLMLGREGPSIQLGAMVGQGVSRVTKGDDIQESILLSSGAGAGLAAAFNAPLAGLMFVLEEVHHNFSTRVALTSFTAAVTANFISLNLFGQTPALDIGAMVALPLEYYGYAVLLGVLLGVFGVLYTKTTLALPSWFAKVPFLPDHFHGVLAYLLIIPVGLFLPQLLGGGSGIVMQLEGWQLSVAMLLLMFVVRFVYSMLAYGSGLPGGIFLPILSLGAILGGAFSQGLIELELLDPAYFTHFIIFAMAGYFTAIGKAPLTAILLVTEMVGGVNQLMPLALTCLAAYITSDFLRGVPIYEALLERLVHKGGKETAGKRLVFTFPITVDSGLVGKAVHTVSWPQPLLITSIQRGEETVMVNGNTVLLPGDLLIVITERGQAAGVQEGLQELAAV